jgi:hypothetical protein
MRPLIVTVLLTLSAYASPAKEIHVAVTGNDNNDGSSSEPYKTIFAPARIAQPGDVITVHGGTYRERATPPRGGFTESDDSNTYLYANFHDRNPNEELVEINVRDSCFYPDQPGRNYITVRGFHMSQAATQWAAPTAEQIGLMGTHWSKGWIIENNVISDSKCSGISLGKDRKTGHNVWINDPRKDGATHYNEVIVRALEAGWSRENIGSHVVRNNVIFNCEQAGIVGSLGAVFSQISNNHIYNIWVRPSSPSTIRGRRCASMAPCSLMPAQGTRITGNLLYDNTTDDLFVEVNHGPFLVDNNLFLSATSLQDCSEGGAYVHNLITGRLISMSEPRRSTPYLKAHSTALAGLNSTTGGDNRFYNNIFVGNGGPPESGNQADANPLRFGGYGLWVYNHREYPLETGGNVYFAGARAYFREDGALNLPGANPKLELLEEGGSVYVRLSLGAEVRAAATRLVDTGLLGKAKCSGLAYENADGSRVAVESDYFGKKRNMSTPFAGPFEDPGQGGLKLKVW